MSEWNKAINSVLAVLEAEHDKEIAFARNVARSSESQHIKSMSIRLSEERALALARTIDEINALKRKEDDFKYGVPSMASVPEHLKEPVKLEDDSTLTFSMSESDVELFDPTREDEYGAASRSALTAYAQMIRRHDSEMSTMINRMIDSIQKKLGIWEGPKKKI